MINYKKILMVAGSPSSYIILLLSIFLISLSCNQADSRIISMQIHLDSLQLKLNKSYKPGLGEFMLNIQVHHAKLWFAGQSGNWSLADFEAKEIQESIEDIRNYCSDREEVTSIPMLNPSLDTIGNAIKRRNISEFKTGFILLTKTCNTCHQITKHPFNVIQIPASPPFSNQDFKPLIQ
jgi:hypothetical protein